MSQPPTAGLFDDPRGEQGELSDPVDPLDVPSPSGCSAPSPRSRRAASADRVPDTEPGVSGDGEADLPEIVTPQNLGRMWASSVGLTSTVATDVDVLHTVVEWGSYDAEQAPAPDGRVRAVWPLPTPEGHVRRPRRRHRRRGPAVRRGPPGRAAALW